MINPRPIRPGSFSTLPFLSQSSLSSFGFGGLAKSLRDQADQIGKSAKDAVNKAQQNAENVAARMDQGAPRRVVDQHNQQSNDEQESMMVNSILQDIENDEDLGDVNADSLNYNVDTSQIPPKIGNELPSMDTIRETTKTIFNNFPTADELMETPQQNEIDDFLNNKLEEQNFKKEDSIKDKSILNRVIALLPILSIILIVFFLLSLPSLNKLIIQFIPKLSYEGDISLLAIMLKALILGIVYLGSSLFL